MKSAYMYSLVPNAEELLALPIEELSRLLLKLLAKNDNPDMAIAHSNFVSRSGKDFLNDIAPSGQLRPTPQPAELTFVAESRLGELRSLSSSQFDFKKLIRLCEELNTVYREGCYFATAMLTRGVLDHLPPLFGKTSFSEVANNYGGGGKSFKETMHHLENAARKVADAHLHMPIRKAKPCPRPSKFFLPPSSTCCSSRLCG